MIYDVVIVGAGVTGAMVARELSKYKLSVCLLEKGNDVAVGATKANSGIIHGGYDPIPGTLKAKMNVSGVELLYKAADELHVQYKNNGSFVCAFGEDEDPTVKMLYERGIENGVKGLEILSGDEARAIEPNLSGEVTSVLNVPNAGIICPYSLCIAAVGNAMDNGAELKRNFEVVSIEKENGIFKVTASSGQCVEGNYLVNCAGGASDKIAKLAGDGFFEIMHRAGEYILLDKTEGGTVTKTIFTVPTKAGKGILVTPTAHGNLLTGPTATRVKGDDSTETTPEGLETVTRLASHSVPTVNFRNVITSFCGVRASECHDDFIIQLSEKVENLIHVAAIDSPGLTSCVSNALYTVELLEKAGLKLEEKSDWNGTREDTHAFAKMNDQEKNEFIKANPDYGRIICRCEGVSEGEIRAAIRREPKALDIDGVKRRTRSGMGRCQGGFCMPYVTRILAEELGIPEEEVTKCGEDSEPIIGKI